MATTEELLNTLTNSVNSAVAATNVTKAALDQKVADAGTAAASALSATTAQASNAATSATQALAAQTAAQAVAANLDATIFANRGLYPTWTALSPITGAVPRAAEVLPSDTGTHTDPVVGGTVSNAGIYLWSASPAGWKWTYPSAIIASASIAEQIAGTNKTKASTPAGVKATISLSVDNQVDAAVLWAHAVLDLERRVMGGWSKDNKFYAGNMVVEAPTGGGVKISSFDGRDMQVNGVGLRVVDIPGIDLCFTDKFGYITQAWDHSGQQLSGNAVPNIPLPNFPVAPVDDMVNVGARVEAGQRNRSDGIITNSSYVKHIRFDKDVRGIRFSFANERLLSTSPQEPSTDAFRVRAEVRTSTQNYDVCFDGGELTKTIPTDRKVITDVIPLRLLAGSSVRVVTYIEAVATGGRWPLGQAAVSALGEGAIAGTNIIGTADASLPALSAGFVYGPTLVLGKMASTTRGMILGDSISFGTGDTPNSPRYDLGCFARALGAAGMPYSHFAVDGDRISRFLGAWKSRTDHAVMSTPTHLFSDLGNNDIAGGSTTLSQMQSQIIALLDWAYALGMKVVLATYLPRTTSNDGWTTLVNQVIATNEAVRIPLNTWLKSGLSHPALAGVWDIATSLEASGDPGKWRIDLGVRTADGIHPNQPGYQKIEADFTAAAAALTV